jgi:DNA invertase Pin-like site-specific DNA recombinase
MRAANSLKHVANYARASRDREELRVSMGRQLSRGHKLAEDLFAGLAVVDYWDNNKSGGDPDVVRPGYDAMVAAIRRGEVADVICHEQSRLTRIPAVWDELVVTLTKAGITKVHTVQQGTVAVEPGNRLVGRIMAVIDAEELERIKARTLANAEQLAGEGRPNGGRYYGYRRFKGDDGRPQLVIDPDQAAVVRRIADAICAGRSIFSIVAELNTEGVPTPQGGQVWRSNAVRSVVSKPAIAGLRSHTGVIVGEARWEGILTPERWRQVLRALGSPVVYDAAGRPRKAPRVSHSNGRRWLLTGGLARCGLCGARMVVGGQRRRGGGWIPAYQCHTMSGPDACRKVSVSPAEAVERLVTDAVLDALDRPEMAARLAAQPDPERQRLLDDLHDATDTMLRAGQMRGRGEIDWETWESMHVPAKARADAASARLAALADPEVDLPPVSEIHQRWEQMSLRQRRALLERFLEVVEIGPRVSGGRPGTTEKRLAMVSERLTLRWKS